MKDQIYSIEEMSDRLAIYDLYARYVHHADAFNYAELDDIFDPDTVLDWTDAGYRSMTWEEARVDPLMGGQLFSHSFHINTNILIRFGPERMSAEVLSKTINPVGVATTQGTNAFQVQGGYVDQLVRRSDRWKIKHRRWRNAFLYSAGTVMSAMGDMLS